MTRFRARRPSTWSKDRSASHTVEGGSVPGRSDSDLHVGAVLSRDLRVLLVAPDDPLAQRAGVVYDDLRGRTVPDFPAFSRDMVDAFIPPRLSDGHVLARRAVTSPSDILLRVALGQVVHPSTATWKEHFHHRGVVEVPIEDLPPSETALLTLATRHKPEIEAFLGCAREVCADLARSRARASAGQPA